MEVLCRINSNRTYTSCTTKYSNRTVSLIALIHLCSYTLGPCGYMDYATNTIVKSIPLGGELSVAPTRHRVTCGSKSGV